MSFLRVLSTLITKILLGDLDLALGAKTSDIGMANYLVRFANFTLDYFITIILMQYQTITIPRKK